MKKKGFKHIVGAMLILSVTMSVTGINIQREMVADVLIYTGDGAWGEGVVAFEKFLEFKDMTWYECEDTYIENNDLVDKFNVIHFPGGDSSLYNSRINAVGMQHIRDFVASGGGYLGICAGSSFACDHVIWQGETYDYPLDLFDGVGYGPIEEIAPWPTYTITSISMNMSNPINQYEPSSEYIMYYGGDSFYADEGQEMHVIGTYELYNNDPAVINFHYGEGRVVLYGPHPEIEEDSARDEVSFADHLEDLGSDWDILWTSMDWLMGESITEPPETLPPEIPKIDGETQGESGMEYEYTFSADDPELEEIYFYVDWGDDQMEEWIGPYSSGEEVTHSHSWTDDGLYMIKAKAKDCNGEESDWRYLEVEMPKSSDFSFFKLFEQHTYRFSLMKDLSSFFYKLLIILT